MTARPRPRGKLARLDALEGAAGVRREAVEAVKAGQLRRALALLSAADRTAWNDAARVMEHGSDPDGLARVVRACAHLPEDLPLSHPAKADAEAWAGVGLSLEGLPLLAPPVGRAADFAAYFEACAAWCDAEAVRLPLSRDAHRLARWGAALWRYEAALCAVIGGQA